MTSLNTSSPPDYLLAKPIVGEVPEIQASCDKEDLDDLKEMKQKGWRIYKLVGRKV
jgi:hypothetical protein